MTDRAVATAEVGVHNKALVAATEDKVTFDRDCESVEVLITVASAASDPIYFTVDGSAPTVEGNNCYVLLGVVGSSLEVPVRTPGDTVVRLISASTPRYSCQGSPGVNG